MIVLVLFAVVYNNITLFEGGKLFVAFAQQHLSRPNQLDFVIIVVIDIKTVNATESVILFDYFFFFLIFLATPITLDK